MSHIKDPKRLSRAYYYPNSKKASRIVKYRNFFLAPVCAIILFCCIVAVPNMTLGVIIGLALSGLVFWYSFYIEKKALKEAVASMEKQQIALKALKKAQGSGTLVRFGDERPFGKYQVDVLDSNFLALMEYYKTREDFAARKYMKQIKISSPKTFTFDSNQIVLFRNCKLTLIQEIAPSRYGR